MVLSRELELAAQALLSGWTILDRLHLLRGLVSLLWRDCTVIRDCTAPLALTEDDKRSAFVELERAIHEFAVDLIS